MRDLVALSDAQIEAAFGSPGSIEDIVFTSDSLASFRRGRRRYADPGMIVQDTEQCLEIHALRESEGEVWRNLTVINFGTARAALML